jgi:aldose sugar dehydrogenase
MFACRAFAVAAVFAISATTVAQTVRDARLVVETRVTGLDAPTSMAFLPDRSLLVLEKNTGRVQHAIGNALTPVLDLDVCTEGTHGLLGIALDPAFNSNSRVFLFYSRSDHDGGPWIENRISAFTFTGGALINEQPLVVFGVDENQMNTGCEGGKLTIGPDGKLYATTGDLMRGDFDNPRIEQNTSMAQSANAGGVIRLNTDGTIPADNPFVNASQPELHKWYAIGIRNSFGLAFDSRTNNLWMTEPGEERYDEINLVTAGFNSGWLLISGPDARQEMNDRNGFTAFDAADLIPLANAHYSDPEFSFFDSIGVTQIVFLNSGRYPADLRGRALVGEYNNGKIYGFALNAARDALIVTGDVADLVADNDAERDSVAFGDDWLATTDLQIGPDGYLWNVSYVDGAVRVIRPIHPTGDMNGDGSLNNFDIDPFVLALINPAAYDAQYPNVNRVEVADANGDGVINNFDIDAFVRLLANP